MREELGSCVAYWTFVWNVAYSEAEKERRQRELPRGRTGVQRVLHLHERGQVQVGGDGVSG
jgi:hypothetical protein